MNLLKMGALIILPLLSIDFARAAEDHNKGGFDPYNLRPPYSYLNSTPAYHGGYGYSSNIGAQAPVSEKEREFKNLEEAFYKQFRESFHISSFGSNPSIEEKIEMIKIETEFKTWENMYWEKFHTSFYCSDYQASNAKKIEMIKEELKLKDVEDAYYTKFRTKFEFSSYGVETSYSIIESTSEKLKIITEEMEYQDLLRSYFDEFQGMPSISDAARTTDTAKIKANQIEALKGEIEIQRLIRDLKSTYSDITERSVQVILAEQSTHRILMAPEDFE